jgi:hypothetical protein
MSIRVGLSHSIESDGRTILKTPERRRPLETALLTTVVELGLSHAMAQTAPAPANPGAMRADARHYARIAPSEHGKNRIGSTYRNLGSDWGVGVAGRAPGGGLNNRILRAFRYSQEEIEVARCG